MHEEDEPDSNLPQQSNTVSLRCKQLIQNTNVPFAKEYSAYKALLDPYDVKLNPNGIINLGTAVSGLMDEILLERFKELGNSFTEMDCKYFRYYSFYGSNEFRQNIAKFIMKFFKPFEPIKFDNILVLNGSLVSLDILISFVADPGEVILVPTPGYPSYFHAGIERWNVNMCPVPMKHNEKTGELFELNLQIIEEVFNELINQGKVVKGFLLNNPHNPTGKVFSKELVLEIMDFCHKNNLHVIADEMYCLSVFDESTKFHSVLELQQLTKLNKNFLHVIWGFSKDLCLTSFRTGFVHTCNEELKLGIILQAQFQAPSYSTMNILNKFISDLDWIEEYFVPMHHHRMKNAFLKTKQCFDSLNIITTNTVAGFFLLADFRPILNPPNKESCEALVKHFYKHKVYMTPSWDMKIVQVGWFRIVFTVTPDTLNEGLKRMQEAIHQWRLNSS